MKNFLAIFIIGFVIIVTTPEVPANDFDSTLAEILQNKIEELRIANTLPGISAAVQIPGQGIWLGTSGISAEGVAVNSDMVFGAGSVTKNFVSSMILQLCDADSLSLNDTLGRWLTGYQNINEAVTIRQLLQHTSGIYNYTENPAFNIDLNADLNRLWTAQDILTGGYILAPYFPPGASYHYSNTNYIILGFIVNKIMHTNLSTELHQRFFTPYYLDQTFVETQDTIKNIFCHNWSDLNGDGILDDAFGIPRTAIYSAALSAGAVVTRPENLVRWISILYEGQVISQSSLSEMLTFIPLSGSGPNGYGLGTMRYLVSGRNCYGHGGNIFGYTSVVMYDPVDRISIAIMTNKNFNGGPMGKSFMATVMQNIPTNVNNITGQVPEDLILYPNYPNPFNPSTTIKFSLPQTEFVRLGVYNTLGEEVQVLFSGVLQAGTYSYNWNASTFSTGVYFYKLQTSGGSSVRKMILMK